MYQILKKYKLSSLHIMVIFLGFTGVLGKLISLETLHLVWYRMLVAFLSLFFFLLFMKQIHSVKKIYILPLLGVGAVVALHWFFFFGAIKVSNISIAVICMSTASLFSAFLEPLFLKRKILKYEVLFGLIVLAALSFMLYERPEQNDFKINYFLGYTYGIIDLSKAAVAMGIDGLLIEIHPDPSIALSDAKQQLNLANASRLLDAISPLIALEKRKLV